MLYIRWALSPCLQRVPGPLETESCCLQVLRVSPIAEFTGTPMKGAGSNRGHWDLLSGFEFFVPYRHVSHGFLVLLLCCHLRRSSRFLKCLLLVPSAKCGIGGWHPFCFASRRCEASLDALSVFVPLFEMQASLGLELLRHIKAEALDVGLSASLQPAVQVYLTRIWTVYEQFVASKLKIEAMDAKRVRGSGRSLAVHTAGCRYKALEMPLKISVALALLVSGPKECNLHLLSYRPSLGSHPSAYPYLSYQKAKLTENYFEPSSHEAKSLLLKVSFPQTTLTEAKGVYQRTLAQTP